MPKLLTTTSDYIITYKLFIGQSLIWFGINYKQFPPVLSIWWYWHLSLNTCLTSLSYKIRAINLSPHSGAGLYRVSFIKIVLLTRVDQLYNLYFRICTAQRPWTRSWSSSDFSYFSLWQHSSLHCPVPNLNSGSLAI